MSRASRSTFATAIESSQENSHFVTTVPGNVNGFTVPVESTMPCCHVAESGVSARVNTCW